MNFIRVERIVADGARVEVNFGCRGRVKRFFVTDRFYAVYEGCCVQNVPEEMLVIPFLSTVCPVAWANHADVYVEAVDEKFLRSLEKVKLALQKFYPEMEFRGRVHANRIVNSEWKGVKSNSMMLFSGGVDSLATFIRHRDEKPILVTIHGADIRVDNYQAWKEKVKDIKNFAQRNNVKLRIVHSNFYDMLNKVSLNIYREKLQGQSWYEKVMHGLALLGLCAPLTHMDNAGKLYIAATHSVKFNRPLGSAPEIDNVIEWSGTRCVHDGFSLSRQQKIQIIADYVRNNKMDLLLKVCLKENGYNCSSGKCEKCSRTIVGLEIAGLDPNRYGFNIDGSIFPEIKESLKNKWVMPPGIKYLWKDIQKHATKKDIPHSEAEEFFNWLKSVKIEDTGKKVNEIRVFWHIATP